MKTKEKTTVQTYVQDDTVELIYDNKKLKKWNERVEELGLKGQKTIVKPEKSPIPFLYMNSSLKNIFSELCPCIVDIEEYDKTPIPVEILDLIQLSMKEGYFRRLQIWFNDSNPDPVCIGETGYWKEQDYYDDSNIILKDKEFNSKDEVITKGGKHPVFYTKDSYLLGRWGNEKKTLDELKQIATERCIENKSNKLKLEIKEKQRTLDDIELKVRDYINGNWVSW